MNDLIKYYVRTLASLNLSLQKKGVLMNKPWAMLDADGEVQKLIFKKDKGLILSKNGNVIEGTWDYFPEAQALLIDRVTDKLLLKEQFIDENIIILKKDGTDNSFFALANENTIPDLNIIHYLNTLKCKAFNICQKKLINGNTLHIYDYQYEFLNLPGFLNLPVHQIDNSYNILNIENGKYMTANKILTFYINNNKITHVRKNLVREFGNGESFEIENGKRLDECVNMNGYKQRNINKSVTFNGKSVSCTCLRDKENIIYKIDNDIIVDINFLFDYQLKTGQRITIQQKNYNKFSKGDKIVDSKPLYPLPDGDYKLKGYMFFTLKVRNCEII